jgi:hypothetical protein
MSLHSCYGVLSRLGTHTVTLCGVTYPSVLIPGKCGGSARSTCRVIPSLSSRRSTSRLPPLLTLTFARHRPPCLSDKRWTFKLQVFDTTFCNDLRSNSTLERLEKGYEVHGVIRRFSSTYTSCINHLFYDHHEQRTLSETCQVFFSHADPVYMPRRTSSTSITETYLTVRISYPLWRRSNHPKSTISVRIARNCLLRHGGIYRRHRCARYLAPSRCRTHMLPPEPRTIIPGLDL